MIRRSPHFPPGNPSAAEVAADRALREKKLVKRSDIARTEATRAFETAKIEQADHWPAWLARMAFLCRQAEVVALSVAVTGPADKVFGGRRT